jgi:hypothetical protein
MFLRADSRARVCVQLGVIVSVVGGGLYAYVKVCASFFFVSGKGVGEGVC